MTAFLENVSGKFLAANSARDPSTLDTKNTQGGPNHKFFKSRQRLQKSGDYFC